MATDDTPEGYAAPDIPHVVEGDGYDWSVWRGLAVWAMLAGIGVALARCAS